MNSIKEVKVQKAKKMNSTIYKVHFSLLFEIPHRKSLGFPSQVLPINSTQVQGRKLQVFQRRSLVWFSLIRKL